MSRAQEEINRRMLRARDAMDRRMFGDVVGVAPSEFRRTSVSAAVPSYYSMVWTRPSSFGQAAPRTAP